jgi:membrane fusion protein (multidrug efflux system)
MKILRSSLVILVVPLLLSCGKNGEKASQRGADRKLQVEGHIVVPQPFNTTIQATAELMANEQLELKAPLSGQVLDIYFKEGQEIRKGDPIIRLDDRDWKAQITGAKAELDAAQKNLDRARELLTVEGSSQEEVDRAISAVETLKSKVQQLRLNIELANITAPFTGRLGMRNFSKGAFLKEGDVITTLAAINPLKVDFRLAQEQIVSISAGKQVLVVVGNDTLTASIYAIDPLIDQQSRTINIRALMQQQPDKLIMPGTFAEVIVTTNNDENALLVPTQAVVPEINEHTVYLCKNGKAVRRVIRMGNRTPDKVQVLNGIEAGDTVITTGLLMVKDGMDLELHLK